jgi:hypothetical protein
MSRVSRLGPGRRCRRTFGAGEVGGEAKNGRASLGNTAARPDLQSSSADDGIPSAISCAASSPGTATGGQGESCQSRLNHMELCSLPRTHVRFTVCSGSGRTGGRRSRCPWSRRFGPEHLAMSTGLLSELGLYGTSKGCSVFRTVWPRASHFNGRMSGFSGAYTCAEKRFWDRWFWAVPVKRFAVGDRPRMPYHRAAGCPYHRPNEHQVSLASHACLTGTRLPHSRTSPPRVMDDTTLSSRMDDAHGRLERLCMTVRSSGGGVTHRRTTPVCCHHLGLTVRRSLCRRTLVPWNCCTVATARVRSMQRSDRYKHRHLGCCRLRPDSRLHDTDGWRGLQASPWRGLQASSDGCGPSPPPPLGGHPPPFGCAGVSGDGRRCVLTVRLFRVLVESGRV